MTPADRVERMRNVLAFFLVGAFVGALVALTVHPIPAGSEQIITYMAGQLSGMAALALGYYFTKGAGQDAADAAKTENTAKMADAITATAKASTTADAGEGADKVADAAADKAAEIKGEA